jgi:hypothetical protein
MANHPASASNWKLHFDRNLLRIWESHFLTKRAACRHCVTEAKCPESALSDQLRSH